MLCCTVFHVCISITMLSTIVFTSLVLVLSLKEKYAYQSGFTSGQHSAFMASHRTFSFSMNLFAKRSILGENIINCREFSLSTPKTVKFVSSYKTFNSMPVLSLPEFSFIGRSNVGKSSLLNTLSGTSKKVATAGKTPGTTKCMNLYTCSDNSGPICSFVDLPGYGFAKLSKAEQDEISRFLRDYFLARGALKLVFLLVDSRRERNLLDEEMFTFLVDHGVPVAIVATKIDKLTNSELKSALSRIRNNFTDLALEAAAKFAHEEGCNGAIDGSGGEWGNAEDCTSTEVMRFSNEVPVIPFSSVTCQGKSELWKVVRDNIITDFS